MRQLGVSYTHQECPGVGFLLFTYSDQHQQEQEKLECFRDSPQGTQKQPHEAKGRSIRVAGGVQFQHAMLQSCLQDQKIHVSPARKGFREEPHGTEIGLKPNLHVLIIGAAHDNALGYYISTCAHTSSLLWGLIYHRIFTNLLCISAYTNHMRVLATAGERIPCPPCPESTSPQPALTPSSCACQTSPTPTPSRMTTNVTDVTEGEIANTNSQVGDMMGEDQESVTCLALGGGLGGLCAILALLLVGVVVGWVWSCHRRTRKSGR